MKLIMENWRQYIDESDDLEELDEGIKDILKKAGMIGAFGAAALGAGGAEAKPFSQDTTLPQNAREVGLTKYDSEHNVHIKKKIREQVSIAIKKLPGRQDQLMKLDNGKKAAEGNPAPLLLGKLFKQVEKALPTFVSSDEEIYKIAEDIVERNLDLDPFSIKNQQKRRGAKR